MRSAANIHRGAGAAGQPVTLCGLALSARRHMTSVAMPCLLLRNSPVSTRKGLIGALLRTFHPGSSGAKG
jgi:hypothetical protein